MTVLLQRMRSQWTANEMRCREKGAESCMLTPIDLFWIISARRIYSDAIVFLIVYMLPGLIYNACQFELASILMLENVNNRQHFKACLHY